MTEETISSKLQHLSKRERLEVEHFIEFLLSRAERGNGDTHPSDLAEAGMGDYLSDLERYEEKLAAGEIRW